MATDTVPQQFYLDDKWKLSKKESLARSCRSSSTTRCAFTRKCASLVKEQRARFYIMRRCVTMLICWRDYRDS
ncbi:small polypeptide DEVIL 11 [Nicotiana tomentosiformis]|uniref:small polypeptide DEVIL 11 n=1 Tax=Nicotiana tomentosiformis TaxID=4098 RepID=UPI00388CA8A9